MCAMRYVVYHMHEITPQSTSFRKPLQLISNPTPKHIANRPVLASKPQTCTSCNVVHLIHQMLLFMDLNRIVAISGNLPPLRVVFRPPAAPLHWKQPAGRVAQTEPECRCATPHRCGLWLHRTRQQKLGALMDRRRRRVAMTTRPDTPVADRLRQTRGTAEPKRKCCRMFRRDSERLRPGCSMWLVTYVRGGFGTAPPGVFGYGW